MAIQAAYTARGWQISAPELRRLVARAASTQPHRALAFYRASLP